MKCLKPLLTSGVLGLLLALSAPLAISDARADEITTFVKNGAAIGGTDPVAYFTQGKPVAGSSNFTTEYDGVTWKFSSAANRDAFRKAPKKYAPQYGGFCAFGAAMGFKVPVIPEAWKIIDGKLYLNNSIPVQKRFDRDPEGHIHNADLNWKIIKDKDPETLTEPIIR